MYNGIINVYKEKGFTSHDVVAKLRGMLKQKKIGHTGTLDPDAEGVLPVCLGKGTKLCDMLTDKNKTYEAVLLLGLSTDTQDISGKVIKKCDTIVDKSSKEIEEAILSFVGEYDQIPPMYSALKVGGKKLYELAREGIEIERKARKVEIYNIDIIEFSDDNTEIRISVSCSKGTYIRTLCNDIGEKLGVGGCMKELLRTKVSQFKLQDAIKLSQIQKLVDEGKIDDYIIPIEQMFTKYKAYKITEEHEKMLINGNKLPLNSLKLFEEKMDKNIQYSDSEKTIRVYDKDREFAAIYVKEAKEYKPEKMFLKNS